MARSRRKANSSFGSRTDVGCVREHNEDSLAVAPPLYVVCDGMGGHAAGEVASEIAVDVITQRAPRHADAKALGQAVEEANLAILKGAREGVGRAGMGCTCTAAILEKERLVIAQVGDSRAYLLHNGRLQQLTRDHSLVNDLVEAGQITPAEARIHPQRSVITRALGSDPRTEPDLFELNVEAGDRLLLCSDGLSTMLEDDQIEEILGDVPDPQRCAAQLVNEAIAAGGYDNVTVIVVDITGMAEQNTRKLTRRTRITAVALIVLLVAILAGAGLTANYLISSSAYLADNNGKVAVYQGVPGELFGVSFSHLAQTTDIAVDDLQPGTANRLKEEGIRVDGMAEAESLVKQYEAEIAEKQEAERLAAEQAAAAAAADAEQAATAPEATPNAGTTPAEPAAPADGTATPDAAPQAAPEAAPEAAPTSTPESAPASPDAASPSA